MGWRARAHALGIDTEGLSVTAHERQRDVARCTLAHLCAQPTPPTHPPARSLAAFLASNQARRPTAGFHRSLRIGSRRSARGCRRTAMQSTVPGPGRGRFRTAWRAQARTAWISPARPTTRTTRRLRTARRSTRSACRVSACTGMNKWGVGQGSWTPLTAPYSWLRRGPSLFAHSNSGLWSSPHGCASPL